MSTQHVFKNHRKQKSNSWLNNKAIDLITKLMPKVCFKICISGKKSRDWSCVAMGTSYRKTLKRKLIYLLVSFVQLYCVCKWSNVIYLTKMALTK